MGPGSGLWFTYEHERKWRCGCGDLVDGLARVWDPGSKSMEWQELDTRDERLIAASIDALNTLQTYLRHALHEPWPATSSAPKPEPGPSILGDTLRLWFGPEGSPLLVFPAIYLD